MRFLSSFLTAAAEEANLMEGVRAAAASALMLLAGAALQMPAFSWAAVGAFWTSLAAATETPRSRLLSMLSFAVLSTLCGGLTAMAAAQGVVSASLALLLVVTLAGLARVLSPQANQVAILVATACVVMVDRPVARPADTGFLWIYLLGTLFATTLSAIICWAMPHAVARHAVRLAYRRLAGLARAEADRVCQPRPGLPPLSRRRQLDAAIDAAVRAISVAANAGRPRAQRGLVRHLDEIWRALFAIEELAAGATSHPERAGRCLYAIARLLARTGRELAFDNTAESGRTRLQRYLLRLRRTMGTAANEPPRLPLRTEAPGDWCDAVAAELHLVARRLRAHATPSSESVHFALRLGIATTIAYWIIHALRLPLDSWATMAVLLILQPSAAGTLPRGYQRSAGTLVGTLLALAIGYLARTPLEISLAVLPLIGLTIALRSVSYSTYVAFLTPSFVLVADYAMPSLNAHNAFARLEDNLFGSAIAMAVALCSRPLMGRAGGSTGPAQQRHAGQAGQRHDQ